MRGIFAAIIFIAWSTGAHATAIYTWDPISGGATCCNGSTLEISDAAYFSGHATLSASILFPHAPDPLTPISAVAMQGFGTSIAEDFAGRPQPDGSTLLDFGFFQFDLSLVGDGLAGSLYVNNLSSALGMSGDPNTWTVTQFITDRAGPCNNDPNDCNGQTGRWVLTSAPTPVPTPSAAALLLIGAAVALRRRA